MTFKAIDAHGWPEPRDLAEFEAALDGGRLYIRMAHGRYWTARRNGVTKRWKRDPARFRVPIKAGLNVYAEAVPDNLSMFRIRPRDAHAKAGIRPAGGL